MVAWVCDCSPVLAVVAPSKHEYHTKGTCHDEPEHHETSQDKGRGLLGDPKHTRTHGHEGRASGPPHGPSSIDRIWVPSVSGRGRGEGLSVGSAAALRLPRSDHILLRLACATCREQPWQPIASRYVTLTLSHLAWSNVWRSGGADRGPYSAIAASRAVADAQSLLRRSTVPSGFVVWCRLVAASALVAVSSILATSAPAAAADATPTTWAEITAAVADGCVDETYTLGASITAPAASTLDLTGCTVTVDLNGFDLTNVSRPLDRAAIALPDGCLAHHRGRSREPRGPSVWKGAGAERVSAATVATTPPAPLVVRGGIVVATGGSSSAGIGGSTSLLGGGAGGTVTVSGGRVTATGGSGAAGIGGGTSARNRAGDGGTLTVSGGTSPQRRRGGAAGIGGGSSRSQRRRGRLRGNDLGRHCHRDRWHRWGRNRRGRWDPSAVPGMWGV